MLRKEDVQVWKDPFDLDAAKVRKLTGLSQRAFANRYGFSLRTLQGWEQGRVKPDKSSRTLLGLIAAAPQDIERIFAKMSSQRQQATKVPQTYLDMIPGESYAFADFPLDQSTKMVEWLYARGWTVGGGHPLANSNNLPPVEKGYVRIWGINWPRR